MTTKSTTTQRWVLGLTSAAALMVALDQLVVATALNQIRDDLHASIATLDWAVNAYSLTFAVLLITGAALGDRFGRKKLFMAGLGLFTVSSAACALAPNTSSLIVARACQGAGSALVMPLAVSLLTAAFPPARRGPVVGIFTAITGLAVVGGPVVGGAVTEGISWTWIFWINVPIGAVLIPLVATRIDESLGARSRPDLVGLVLASVGMLGLVWGLIRADTAGWSSPEVVISLAAGAVVSVAFVRWELRVPEPMLPMQLFTIRAFAAGNAGMLLLTASLFGTVFFLAQYLQVSLGYSPFEAGLRFVPWTATLFVVAPLAGMLSARIGERRLFVVGLGLQGGGIGWLAHNVSQGRPYTSSIVALVVAGCGTSMALPSGQNAVMNAVRSVDLGKASGTFNAVRQLGGVLGIAVLSAVFSAKGDFSSPASFRHGVAPALTVASGIAVAGAIVGLLMAAPQTPPHAVAAEPIDERAGVDAGVR